MLSINGQPQVQASSTDVKLPIPPLMRNSPPAPIRTVPLNFVPPSALDMPLTSRRRGRSRSPGAKEERYQVAAGNSVVDRYRERSPTNQRLVAEAAAYTDSDRYYQPEYQLPYRQTYQPQAPQQTYQPQAPQQTYQPQAPQQTYQPQVPYQAQAPYQAQPQPQQPTDSKATTGRCRFCTLANRSAARPETEGCYSPSLHRCPRFAACLHIDVCCYYHTREEINKRMQANSKKYNNRFYKSIPCYHFHIKGRCELGARCCFVHDVSEMHCHFCGTVGKHLPVNCPLNPRQMQHPTTF